MRRMGLNGENSVKYVGKLLDIWNGDNCIILVDWQIPIEAVAQMMIEVNVTRCFVE